MTEEWWAREESFHEGEIYSAVSSTCLDIHLGSVWTKSSVRLQVIPPSGFRQEQQHRDSLDLCTRLFLLLVCQCLTVAIQEKMIIWGIATVSDHKVWCWRLLRNIREPLAQVFRWEHICSPVLIQPIKVARCVLLFCSPAITYLVTKLIKTGVFCWALPVPVTGLTLCRRLGFGQNKRLQQRPLKRTLVSTLPNSTGEQSRSCLLKRIREADFPPEAELCQTQRPLCDHGEKNASGVIWIQWWGVRFHMAMLSHRILQLLRG